MCVSVSIDCVCVYIQHKCVRACVRAHVCVQYDAMSMQSSQQKAAMLSNKQIHWHRGCVCVGERERERERSEFESEREGVLYCCKCVYLLCECVNKCERQRQSVCVCACVTEYYYTCKKERISAGGMSEQ